MARLLLSTVESCPFIMVVQSLLKDSVWVSQNEVCQDAVCYPVEVYSLVEACFPVEPCSLAVAGSPVGLDSPAEACCPAEVCCPVPKAHYYRKRCRFVRACFACP